MTWIVYLFIGTLSALNQFIELNLFIEYTLITYKRHLLYTDNIESCVCKELHLQEVAFTWSYVHMELHWTNY